jgi:hypothetical protein
MIEPNYGGRKGGDFRNGFQGGFKKNAIRVYP